jgi:hypothetical protein
MVLGLDPVTAGRPEGPVHGALLETTFDNGTSFTLVSLADGTTSLYTSTGGGVIGAGTHDVVAAATLRFLDVVAGSLHLFEPDPDDAVPPPGHAALRALTPAGRRRVLAPEADLGKGRHPASAVFRAAHDVITQVRLTEQARG